ncbi:3-phytase (myo-inositol-hexaphosphate 3-phosphohydrolase) [Nostoc sp. PCC 7524]|uniref:phytase n=1 Tax=Nostoc sp. (strain ATCC 29411 / PCC 7524) TaxID=28072 RepID=UPI00029F2E32|nr:phytase [Nostoc sp. PCC 7524]AFY48778.1 3-phytase (myo-inositol-hexaphosphate 3-phosphohydrolase) [Nostoc sp. PCC 7524]
MTTLRFSQFNASLNRGAAGQLVSDLTNVDNPNNDTATQARINQAKTVAEIIQRNNPDILLINEFDYAPEAVDLFKQNFLEVSQNGATPVTYQYAYIAPSNTGIASGFDLNNDGTVGGGNDAFGFGNFPGQFGMLLLSKYEIDTENVRTFQNFLWKDMPGSLLTDDPTVDNPNTPASENLNGFYSPEEIEILRLSSKSHWDVPIKVNGETVHVLVSHPTPPLFDDPANTPPDQIIDWNGKRNHDEIRFWADYVTPGKGDYIYDDNQKTGGLAAGSRFVIMGDQNADPNDGDSYNNAILQLLQNPGINTNSIPSSPGAAQQASSQGIANNNHKSNPSFDTADFNDNAPGNLRADYVLPSVDLQITNSGVFWPLNTDPTFPLVGTFTSGIPGGFPSSDHRLVFADVQMGATEKGASLPEVEFEGETTFVTGFVPGGAAGTEAVGGLSGVVYDAGNQVYYALSDARSDASTGGSVRFYTFTADLTDITNPQVSFTDVTTLTDAEGDAFAPFSLDPEGFALTNNGTVFVSSEGEASANRVIDPLIKEFNLSTGQEIRSLPVPEKFKPVFNDFNNNGVLDAGEQTSGVRNNLAFESLTITPDQKTLYTATESALTQDGAIATTQTGARARIIQYNLASGQPEKEYLYMVDPVAEASSPANAFTVSGLVDLLAIDNRGTFLALERSFSVGAPGTGNTIKIYEVSLQGATDISTIDSLAGDITGIQAVQKRLLLNLNELNLPNGLDNIEGLAFGPKLADGRQSIVLVSDNNFNAIQFTQILTLSADLVPTATPRVETRPDLLDDETLPTDQQADADDPAIYLHPTDSARSLVLTAVKNAGLRVYDLSGNLLQTINPGGIRYNNIDLQYGFILGGQKIDIAVASDRRNDKLAIFKINPDATGNNYLEDITDTSIGAIFTQPTFPNSIEDESHAYGLALYRSPITNDYYVFVNRRNTGDVAQLKLVDNGSGKISTEFVRGFTVTPPPEIVDAELQTEGMVVDQETGYLYIGQENVGLWKFEAEPTGNNQGKLIDRIKEFGGSNLVDDVEGLSIYYGADGKGYLLVSSQGDNTFAVYRREGDNEFIGRFAVGNNGSIDSVQESDGADVINVPLGANFPFGLFVTQDGNNDPEVLVEDEGELENINSNFKFVPWENIANSFPEALAIDITSYDPRNPVNRIAAQIKILPALNQVADDIFQITGGENLKLKVTVLGRNSQLVNELGVFTVDDTNGTIDGIAPGAVGYTNAALARSKVIFSAIANNPNGFNPANLVRLLEFNENNNLRFYLIKNSSKDAVNTGTISSDNIIFSSNSTQKITNLGTEGFSLGWTEGSSSEFNDLEVKIKAVDESFPLGTNLQGQSQGEVIDLLGVTGSITANFIVNREAAFNNFVGFYKVANINGGIDTNNDGVADILPGQSGYIQAAVENRIAGIDLTVNNQGTATYTGRFQGGSIFAPFIIIDGRPDALLDSNTTNDPAVYFPYLGANADNFDHIRLLGDNVFGFEDLPNGGDQDFNDVIVQVNLSVV